MINLFVITLIIMLFFVGCLAFTLLRKGPISSCHEGETDQDCGFCTKPNDEKEVLKKKMLKKARAVLASYYPDSNQ